MTRNQLVNIISLGLSLLVATCVATLITASGFSIYQYMVIFIAMCTASILFLRLNKSL